MPHPNSAKDLRIFVLIPKSIATIVLVIFVLLYIFGANQRPSFQS